MSVSDLVANRLKVEEGFSEKPYKDSLGILTGGYGTNLEVAHSANAWFAMMHAEVDETDAELQRFPWYTSQNDVRKSVLCDMAYNMGLDGLLHFPHMLSAVANGDYQTAHDEMLNSLWAKQVGQRATNLAALMLRGE